MIAPAPWSFEYPSGASTDGGFSFAPESMRLSVECGWWRSLGVRLVGGHPDRIGDDDPEWHVGTVAAAEFDAERQGVRGVVRWCSTSLARVLLRDLERHHAAGTLAGASFAGLSLVAVSVRSGVERLQDVGALLAELDRCPPAPARGVIESYRPLFLDLVSSPLIPGSRLVGPLQLQEIQT